MPSVLHATAVTYGQLAEGVEHAAWSEDGGDGPNLIILRRSGDPDGYTLIVNDNPRCGGILAYEVTTGETRLTLTSEAAHELGLERDLTLNYSTSTVDETELQAVLERMLASHERGARLQDLFDDASDDGQDDESN